MQGREIFKQYRVEFFWMFPGSGQAAHPNAIRDQDMVERAVETPEIDTNLLAIHRLA